MDINISDKGEGIVFAYSHGTLDVAFHSPESRSMGNLCLTHGEALKLAAALTKAVRAVKRGRGLNLAVFAKRR